MHFGKLKKPMTDKWQAYILTTCLHLGAEKLKILLKELTHLCSLYYVWTNHAEHLWLAAQQSFIFSWGMRNQGWQIGALT